MKITDPGIRLSRWRLILSEYHFEVKYRRGAHNHVVEAISRLPTHGYSTPDPELDIPTFLVEERAVPDKFRVTHEVHVSSWTKHDWDPYDGS